MMFFVLVFIDVAFWTVQGRQWPDLMDLHEKIKLKHDLKDVDMRPIVEPLTFLKEEAFYRRLMINEKLDLPNITMECFEDFSLIAAVLMNKSDTVPGFVEVFAQMKDATAVIPPGVLRGPHAFFGFKQECDVIKYTPSNRARDFQTGYSRVYLNLTGDCSQVGLSFDICMPKGCTSNDLMQIVDLIPKLDPSLQELPVCTITTLDDVHVPLGTGGWLTLALLIVLATLGVLAGITDYLLEPKSPIRKGYGIQAFLAFSIYTNVSEILRAPRFKEGQIGPLNCIRVVSMFWVMFGHVIEIYVSYSNNVLDFKAVLDYPLSQLGENGWFSVDSFFFISGLLLSFMWFKSYNKNSKATMAPSSWIMFYVHRIIRLSMPFYVVLIFYAYVYIPMINGSVLTFTPQPTTENLCQKNIWKSILYFANLIDYEEICMGHAWYLATDMQIFVLTPVILIPLAWKPLLGLVVAAILLVLSTAANVITVYINRYPPTYVIFGPLDPEMTNYIEYQKNVYYAMWIRCQVYIMGIIVGWGLQTFKKIRIHPLINMIGWILAISLMLTVEFGLFHYFQGHQLPLFWRAAYSALSKPAWALGLTWIVISCYYGYGGPINSFMSWNIWAPLGKLSYSAYLVHALVLLWLFSLPENASYYSSMVLLLANFYAPTIILTFTVALLLSALVEVPAGKLEALLLRPRPHQIRHAPNEVKEKTSWDVPSNTDGIVNEKGSLKL